MVDLIEIKIIDNNFAFPEGVQDAKIAQVMAETQNSEGAKMARKIFMFACMCLFLFSCQAFCKNLLAA